MLFSLAALVVAMDIMVLQHSADAAEINVRSNERRATAE